MQTTTAPTITPADLIAMNQLLTVEEVCRMTALSRTGIYDLMERGELEYVKLGRTRRLKLESIRKLIDKSTVSRTPAAG